MVDFDQYEQSGMFVANGVSPELDRLKHTYYGLPDFLTQVVQHELTTRVPRSLTAALCLQKWSIVYMPQVLKCIALKCKYLGKRLDMSRLAH